MAGTAGLTPKLAGCGDLVGATAVGLSLTDARPNSNACWQEWIQDPAAVHGFAASNGLRSSTP